MQIICILNFKLNHSVISDKCMYQQVKNKQKGIIQGYTGHKIK